MKRKAISLLGALLLLTLLVWYLISAWGPRPEPRYRVIDLGTLPKGNTSSAMDINDRGEVVGLAEAGIGQHATFVWSATGEMRSLGIALFDCRINEHGMVVGRTGAGGATEEVFLWTPKDGLRSIGAWSGHFYRSIGLNDRGEVVWSRTINSATGVLTYHSFIWDATKGKRELRAGNGSIFSVADINNQGHIVGQGIDTTGTKQGFLTQDGTNLQFLSYPPDRKTALFPVRVSERGAMLVQVSQGDGYHGVLRKDGKYIDLGTFGGNRTDFSDFNSRYQVVGDSQTLKAQLKEDLSDGVRSWIPFLSDTVDNLLRGSNINAFQPVPFLWEQGKMYVLNDLIHTDSEWTLQSAAGINDRGQIVGWGVHDGRQHAFFLTPIEETGSDDG